MKNTKTAGRVTHFVYWHKDRYIGVCLEFDIVDEDTDKEVLFERLQERAASYVAYVCEKGHDDALLNRHAPKKYWNLFLAALDSQRRLAKAGSVGRAMPSAVKSPDFVIFSQTLPVCA
jgi:hypothetical protein